MKRLFRLAACKTGLPNDSGMLAARKSPFCLGLP